MLRALAGAGIPLARPPSAALDRADAIGKAWVGWKEFRRGKRDAEKAPEIRAAAPKLDLDRAGELPKGRCPKLNTR